MYTPFSPVKQNQSNETLRLKITDSEGEKRRTVAHTCAKEGNTLVPERLRMQSTGVMATFSPKHSPMYLDMISFTL